MCENTRRRMREQLIVMRIRAVNLFYIIVTGQTLSAAQTACVIIALLTRLSLGCSVC